jgi:creatinine amidohydrolase/Fe(II)-dependent formamide hydrolase-like protein
MVGPLALDLDALAGRLPIGSILPAVLDAAARSLKVHGFKEILFIGDSGGNQGGMTNVANKLNEEWKDAGVSTR